jgi:hypothetical protein
MEETPVETTQKYIEGIQWPATKDEVLEAMQDNGAPDDVMQALRDDGKDRYTAPSDIHHTLWKKA